MSNSNVVVMNQFKNQQSPSNSGSPKSFINNYMLRDGAVEPLVLSDKQQSNMINQLQKLNAPYDEDAVNILNHKLHYSGVGFSKDNIAVDRKDANNLADQCQSAYDRGGTVKQMVISFRTAFLQEQNVLDDEIQPPYRRGDFYHHVDQFKLRNAVQDGLNEMLKHSDMHEPTYIGAVQTDTQAVHVHLSVWDNDKNVVNDRGKLNQQQMSLLKDGIQTSLKNQLPHLNNTKALHDLAEQTQKNALFKQDLLQKQLRQSALRLDKNSLHNYVYGLARFDQRSLSARQRDHLEVRIQDDWRLHGIHDKGSYRLHVSQRRDRRQNRAMKKAYQLRSEMDAYNQAALRNKTSIASRSVYRALKFEYQQQLRIVEKYRSYHRPRVNVIYKLHQKQLQMRRETLLQQRQKMLSKLGAKPLSKFYTQRLLQRTGVMQGVANDYPGVPLTQTKPYKELVKSQDEPLTPLSDETVHVIKKHVPHKEQSSVDYNLTKNQRIQANVLTPQQRLWLLQYQKDLMEYEMDAISFGGLASDKLSDWTSKQEIVPKPLKTQSIYDRPLGRNQPDLVASDAHNILKQGHLRPEIELALRRRVSKRAENLHQAYHYFTATKQQVPQWLQESRSDLRSQLLMLQRSSKTDNLVDEPRYSDKSVITDGYKLDNEQANELVRQHVKDVHSMEL